MANNCLLTTLPGTVSADLPKLGELRIGFSSVTSPTTDTQSFQIISAAPQTITISGGTFMDSTLTSNQGTSKTIPAGQNTYVYFSNSDAVISIPDKYAISKLDFKDTSAKFDLVSLAGMTRLTLFSVCNCAQVDGDYAVFADSPMTYINTISSGCHGDISAFAGRQMTFVALANAVGNLSAFNAASDLTYLLLSKGSGTGITGNLSVLSGKNALTTLSIGESATLAGNLSILSGMTELDRLVLPHTSVTGNISSLSNLTKLNHVNLVGGGNITGNISVFARMPDLEYLYMGNTGVSGSRASLSDLTKLKVADFTGSNVTA